MTRTWFCNTLLTIHNAVSVKVKSLTRTDDALPVSLYVSGIVVVMLKRRDWSHLCGPRLTGAIFPVNVVNFQTQRIILFPSFSS